jgi:hypothetical protein
VDTLCGGKTGYSAGESPKKQEKVVDLIAFFGYNTLA